MIDKRTGKDWKFRVVQIVGGGATNIAVDHESLEYKIDEKPIERSEFDDMFGACELCDVLQKLNNGHRFAIEPIDITPKEETSGEGMDDSPKELDDTPDESKFESEDNTL